MESRPAVRGPPEAPRMGPPALLKVGLVDAPMDKTTQPAAQAKGAPREPGTPLAYSEELLPGPGTFDDGTQIRAAVYGTERIDPETMGITVQPAGRSVASIERGDIVVGQVTYIKPEALASVKILAVRGKEGRSWPPTGPTSASSRPGTRASPSCATATSSRTPRPARCSTARSPATTAAERCSVLDWRRLLPVAAGALLIAAWVADTAALVGKSIGKSEALNIDRAVTIPILFVGMMLVLVPLLPPRPRK